MNSSIKQGVLILLGEEHTHNNHDKDAFEVVFVSARVLSICTKYHFALNNCIEGVF
jgi:hypothetical protein